MSVWLFSRLLVATRLLVKLCSESASQGEPSDRGCGGGGMSNLVPVVATVAGNVSNDLQ